MRTASEKRRHALQRSFQFGAQDDQHRFSNLMVNAENRGWDITPAEMRAEFLRGRKHADEVKRLHKM